MAAILPEKFRFWVVEPETAIKLVINVCLRKMHKIAKNIPSFALSVSNKIENLRLAKTDVPDIILLDNNMKRFSTIDKKLCDF